MANKPRQYRNDSRTHYGDDPRNTMSPSMIERLWKQDKSAIDDFGAIYTKLVRKWCREESAKEWQAILRDDREQIVNDIMMKAVRNLRKHDKDAEPIESIRAWLRTIAKNTILDFLLRRKNKQCKGIDVLAGDTVLKEQHEKGKSPLDLVDDEEEKQIIREQIIKLIKREFKNMDRELKIYQLTIIEGKTAVEVAETMNMTRDNVAAIKSRILKRIRQEFVAHDVIDE